MLVLLPLTSCTTLTPTQSAGLNEAQEFADEVTKAYGVPRVKVIVDDRGMDGYTEYWERNDWITIRRTDLDRGNARLAILNSLAAATLPPHPARSKTADERWLRFERNRRGVEIMVRFLGATTRQAVHHYAASLVKQNDVGPRGIDPSYGLGNWYAAMRFWSVPPCDQLHDLWSHFAMREPAPPCQTTAIPR